MAAEVADKRIEIVRAYLKANGVWDMSNSDMAYLVKTIDMLVGYIRTSVPVDSQVFFVHNDTHPEAPPSISVIKVR